MRQKQNARHFEREFFAIADAPWMTCLLRFPEVESRKAASRMRALNAGVDHSDKHIVDSVDHVAVLL